MRDLLGDTFELELSEGVSPQEGLSGEAMWELMSTSYGPTKTLAESLEPERREALARDFSAFFEEHRHNNSVRLERQYLRITGRRRA